MIENAAGLHYIYLHTSPYTYSNVLETYWDLEGRCASWVTGVYDRSECMRVWTVWEHEENENRCKNRSGGGEHKGGQIQQQVTRDHSLGNLIWLSVQELRVDLYFPQYTYNMYSHPTMCITHHFVVLPPTMEVNWAISSMLQHRPAATSSLHVTEYLWKWKKIVLLPRIAKPQCILHSEHDQTFCLLVYWISICAIHNYKTIGRSSKHYYYIKATPPPPA